MIFFFFFVRSLQPLRNLPLSCFVMPSVLVHFKFVDFFFFSFLFLKAPGYFFLWLNQTTTAQQNDCPTIENQ